MEEASLVSDEDLATAVRVLRTLATTENGIYDEFRTPRCKPLRQAMHLYLEDLRGSIFFGGSPDKYTRRKEKKREKNAREQQERALDREAADKTRMRAERLRMLGELEDAAAATDGAPRLAYVPDGAVDDDASRVRAVDHHHATAHENENGDAVTTIAVVAETTELHALQACYTCKSRFRKLHHFYAQLCPACAALNYTKRLQTAELSGRVFLVTGARVKIGFQVALKLLRCGATVLATSRFPADTAARYAAQADAPEWLERLQCYGLDLRDLSGLERFCAFLLRRRQRIDGIINNACQTIRRPAAYYAPLLPAELQPQTWSTEAPLWAAEPEVRQPDEGSARDFPTGLVDVNGQQVDTRTSNSWLLKLHEVSTAEAAEVLAINALAPFILNSRLRPLLEACPSPRRFVINVSAMEGKFYRYKSPHHPHTNMAKAALNMMTRTCAEELSTCGIFMNSVDTGWINDEKPISRAAAHADTHHFQCPLDEVDAAARILDPVLSTVASDAPPPLFGKFLKDYAPSEW